MAREHTYKTLTFQIESIQHFKVVERAWGEGALLNTSCVMTRNSAWRLLAREGFEQGPRASGSDND